MPFPEVLNKLIDLSRKGNKFYAMHKINLIGVK